MCTHYHRHLTVEALEPRHLLAATADIVMVIDESGSQRATAEGDAVRPWASLIVEQLEAKLVSRGIGDEQNLHNRYGVIAFGKGDPNSIPPRLLCARENHDVVHGHVVVRRNIRLVSDEASVTGRLRN